MKARCESAFLRLDGALGRIEIDPALQPIVRVAGALREDAAQGVDVGRHACRRRAAR